MTHINNCFHARSVIVISDNFEVHSARAYVWVSHNKLINISVLCINHLTNARRLVCVA